MVRRSSWAPSSTTVFYSAISLSQGPSTSSRSTDGVMSTISSSTTRTLILCFFKWAAKPADGHGDADRDGPEEEPVELLLRRLNQEHAVLSPTGVERENLAREGKRFSHQVSTLS